MRSLKESILKSNSASHPAYRFSWYRDDSVIWIVVTCNSTAAIPRWDKTEVEKEYKKLDEVYKKDIRYAFNEHSKSKNTILTHILCIILSCKSYEEIKEKISGLLKDDSFIIDRVGPVGGDDNIRIAFKSNLLYSALVFFNHPIGSCNEYKYVK